MVLLEGEANIDSLRCQVAEAEQRLDDLRRQLQEAEHLPIGPSNGHYLKSPCSSLDTSSDSPAPFPVSTHPLELEEYTRYGRQMIVPSIGLEGQLKLKNAKVLVVGVGGLGSPAALYLAGAGVGQLGLVDGDNVELSNLHRQVLHSSDTVGWNKARSAAQHLKRLNSNVEYRQYPTHLTPRIALDLFEQYDLILDCTDHPTSRYLISDACVLAGKPLISASALKTDGQLMTLNMSPGFGPCYRCVFPRPPPADSVISCGEGGIIGPVVGVMGVLQAAKAMEMITMHAALERYGSPRLIWQDCSSLSKLLIYSAFDPQPFRPPIALKKRKGCAACSATPSVTEESLKSGSLDYAAFCGLNQPLNLLGDQERITAEQYKQQMQSQEPHILVDVREKLHFDICHIPASISVPYSLFALHMRERSTQDVNGDADHSGPCRADPLGSVLRSCATTEPQVPIFFICRLGNDSQEAVKFVRSTYPELIQGNSSGRFIGDIMGGLQSWSRVDPTFPDY